MMRSSKLKALVVLVVATGALAAPAIASPPAKTIRIGDYFYRPGKLTIKQGTRVTWKWVGAAFHNVVVISGPSKFRSPDQTTGSFSHTFRRKGTYHLECTIHSWMTATIVVR